MNDLKLFPHQKDAIDWMVNRPKVVLCLPTGLGKTIIAIQTFKPNDRILVICPNSLKLNWYKEITKFCKFKPKIKLIKKRSEDFASEGINIINYDIIGKRESKKIIPSFDYKNFDLVVLDESQAICNPTAIRTKIAAKIIKITPRAVLLSATPIERPIQFYTSLFAIGCIDIKYHTYGVRFCDAKKLYFYRREVWDYKGKSNLDELKRLISNHVLVMKKDILKLPPVSIKVISVDLPIDKREKRYNLNDIEEINAPIGFEGLSELIKDQAMLKLPLAISHIKMRLESENKILIFAKHHDVIDELMEKLKSYNPVKLDGRDSIEKRDLSVEKFQNDKDTRLFIGQIKASGTGLTLTASRFCIFVEADWSYTSTIQALSRIDRIGQTRNVYVEILTINRSIDEYMIIKNLQKKETIKELGLEL